MVKPRFYVESQIIIWKKTPTYLVSGSTIQHCIISSLKEQFFLLSGARPFLSGGLDRLLKAVVNVKAVLTSLNTAFLPISRSRFKQR